MSRAWKKKLINVDEKIFNKFEEIAREEGFSTSHLIRCLIREKVKEFYAQQVESK